MSDKEKLEKQTETKRRPGAPKGNRNNPHGRPKTGNAIAQMCREFLYAQDPKTKKERALVLFQKAYEIACEKGKNAVSAIDLLLSRGFGKPIQPIDESASLSDYLATLSEEELRIEREKLSRPGK